MTVFKTELQDALIEAMTSGESTQARGSLRYDDGFCCLGVACDIYQKKTGNGQWVEINREDGHTSWAFDVGDERETAGLPDEVYHAFGFGEKNEMVMGTLGQYMTNDDIQRYLITNLGNAHQHRASLSSMNDSGVPLAEVGKFIKEFRTEIF